jgi:hypothetical protein
MYVTDICLSDRNWGTQGLKILTLGSEKRYYSYFKFERRYSKQLDEICPKTVRKSEVFSYHLPPLV